MTSLQEYLWYRRNFHRINLESLTCRPDLGLLDFGILSVKSEGVSGDVLAEGAIRLDRERLPVVVKIYSTLCPKRLIQHAGRTRIMNRNIVDETRFEIGNTLALTQYILLNDRILTPHIIFAFGYGICPWAYQTNTGNSSCNPSLEVPSSQHLVPANCSGRIEDRPQCVLRSNYEAGLLNDIVRYLVVEKGSGDLEQWIVFNLRGVQAGHFDLSTLDYHLASLLIMIAYTLYVLDDFFDGFVHGDLGPRNILYTQVERSPKFLKYSLGPELNLYVEQSLGVVPKLWDFDKSYINNLPRSAYFYLTDQELERPPPPFREDLSILLRVIRGLIESSGSQLLPLIDDILPLAQSRNNREMAVVFLAHPILSPFREAPPDWMVEATLPSPLTT